MLRRTLHMKTINILVADHSETTRKEFADFFEKRKDMHLMDSVDNGQDACNAILNRKPDIVLLDVVLPVMDGFSVIEKVNGDDSLLHAPAFIVVSSIGNQSMIECACKLGVAYYILKPFSLDNLAGESCRSRQPERRRCGRKRLRKKRPARRRPERSLPPVTRKAAWKRTSPVSSGRSGSRRISRAISISGKRS